MKFFKERKYFLNSPFKVADKEESGLSNLTRYQELPRDGFQPSGPGYGYQSNAPNSGIKYGICSYCTQNTFLIGGGGGFFPIGGGFGTHG